MIEAAGLLLIAFALGAKHGLDADHIATIDGLTRWSQTGSKRCGLFFSLGHGAVVVLMACALAYWAKHWQVPIWFEQIGAAISMLLLTTLGCLNLYQVWVTPKGQRVQARGLWRAKLLSRLLSMQFGFSPAVWCFAIGALFALSFDTLSQASLFALSSNEQGSPWFALVLALAFTAGMMLTDGVNGWLVAEVLSRSDRAGWVASRLLSVLVALLSFTVAGLGASKWLIPQWDAWLSDHAAWLGLGLTALVLGAGLGFARSPRHTSKDESF